MLIPIRYNLRSLAVRKTTTAATALGIALVVFVFSAALMLSEGIKKTMAVSASPNRAIVVRKGSDSEMSSAIELPQAGLVLSMPGVLRDSKGPVGTSEMIMVIAMEKTNGDGFTNVQLRGVTEDAYRFRPQAKIVQGRPARPGTDEVVIGQRLLGRYPGMQVGGSFEFRKNRKMQVVGIFSDDGSSHESEIWADADTTRAAFGREGFVNSVRVVLESESKFDGFKTAVEMDKRAGLEAYKETDFLVKQSENTAIFVTAMGTVISVFFGLAAMIGAMITMYAAVAQRKREVGTLRALGFPRSRILISFLIESVLLALAGGAVGIAAASLLKFVHVSMMNFQTFSDLVFSFDPTLRVLATALAFSVAMGLIGGMLPAIRAARVSPVNAMRDGA
jgi:putative ABC transport system permease protein